MVDCPECSAPVDVAKDTEEGEILTCPECGVELEVTSIDPVKLEVAPQEEEDWGQ